MAPGNGMNFVRREKIQLLLSAAGLVLGATIFVVSSSVLIMAGSLVLGSAALLGLVMPFAQRIARDLFPGL